MEAPGSRKMGELSQKPQMVPPGYIKAPGFTCVSRMLLPGYWCMKRLDVPPMSLTPGQKSPISCAALAYRKCSYELSPPYLVYTLELTPLWTPVMLFLLFKLGRTFFQKTTEPSISPDTNISDTNPSTQQENVFTPSHKVH